MNRKLQAEFAQDSLLLHSSSLNVCSFFVVAVVFNIFIGVQLLYNGVSISAL